MVKFFGYQVSGEVLDWGFDWSEWLQEGDGIASSAWESTGDLAISDTGVSGAESQAWISGEAAGTQTVKNTITTTNGRTAIRTFELRMIQV